MRTILKVAAWLLIAATVFASLGPPGSRPHSGLGQDGEHALAFILVGLVVGLAYPRRRIATALAAVMLTGVLELAQFLAPGRHARWEDFLVDASALTAGLVIAAILNGLVSRWRTPALG